MLGASWWYMNDYKNQTTAQNPQISFGSILMTHVQIRFSWSKCTKKLTFKVFSLKMSPLVVWHGTTCKRVNIWIVYSFVIFDIFSWSNIMFIRLIGQGDSLRVTCTINASLHTNNKSLQELLGKLYFSKLWLNIIQCKICLLSIFNSSATIFLKDEAYFIASAVGFSHFVSTQKVNLRM